MPPRQGRRLCQLVAVLLLTIGAVRPCVAGGPFEIGRPHPTLVLWTIAGETAISIDAYRETKVKVLVIYFASWSPHIAETLAEWQQRTGPLVADHKLVLLGVMEEQYADRCRLFAQWKMIKDMPLLHDPLNLVGVDHLPTAVAVDEHGFVRLIDPDPDRLEADFVGRKFKYDKHDRRPPVDDLPDPRYTKRMAGEAQAGAAWRKHGDALVLGGLPPQINEAITTYPRALALDPDDALAYFDLGVAQRIRYDRPQRQPGDFQAAIDAWHEAVQRDRRNAVFRGRLAQYGLRLDRTNAMYRWIRTARRQIVERGQTPVELTVEPIAAEMATPQKKFKSAKGRGPRGDPDGTAQPDHQPLIGFEAVVVPSVSAKRKRYRQVLLIFRPSEKGGARWDNRGDPLRVWIDPPKGVRVSRKLITFDNPKGATSAEERTVAFAVKLPKKSEHRAVTMNGHALYRVIAGGQDSAQLLRRDFAVKLPHKSGR